MQPYLFPYIGYFQLINAVDCFVIYDDVTFIRQGWINRNQILIGGKPSFFTVPIKKQSSYRRIRETQISEDTNWVKKFFSSLKHSYGKTPYFNEVMDIVTGVFSLKTPVIGELSASSIFSVCDYLGIKTKFIRNSDKYNNSVLRKEERIIDICRQEGAHEYINLSGGKDLYSKENFSAHGINLRFLESSRDIIYTQFATDFTPYLSIIDMMMFNPVERIQGFLRQYILS